MSWQVCLQGQEKSVRASDEPPRGARVLVHGTECRRRIASRATAVALQDYHLTLSFCSLSTLKCPPFLTGKRGRGTSCSGADVQRPAVSPCAVCTDMLAACGRWRRRAAEKLGT